MWTPDCVQLQGLEAIEEFVQAIEEFVQAIEEYRQNVNPPPEL